jgi:hypothetical protein
MCVPDFGRGRWSRGQPEGDPGSGAGRARGVGGGPGRGPAGGRNFVRSTFCCICPRKVERVGPDRGQGSIRSSFRCPWLEKVERVGPDRGQVSIRSTLCCLSQEKVERVGSRGDRAGPDARATTLLTQPRARPRNRKPATRAGGWVCPARRSRRPAGSRRRRSPARRAKPREYALASPASSCTNRRAGHDPARPDAARTECGPPRCGPHRMRPAPAAQAQRRVGASATACWPTSASARCAG